MNRIRLNLILWNVKLIYTIQFKILKNIWNLLKELKITFHGIT